ncbi:WxL protein peptidoglycan domain-containing protein [Rummeliibacillus pycnus]|uniref:WxL protein peptidoglycan domain-containing protein n=1 Tax=Rummeliibacillus pycnus TaxID=101070 RepID=UPI003D281608
MKKRKFGRWLLSFFAVFMILGSLIGSPVSAAENNRLPYSIIPVFPENQDKDVSQYISITSKNGVNQQISFQLANNTKAKQQVNMKILNAYTSPNGIIQYETKKTEDAMIIAKEYEMKKYAKIPKSITLNAGQVKTVKVDIDIPKIKGSVLGGIAFQITEKDSQESNKKGVTFSLKNKINTIYGIAVHSSKNHKAKFSFGDVFVDPMATYYAVRLPITLHSPLIIHNANINYKVSHKGKKLFFAKKSMKFAPMTKTNFSIPFDYKEIKQGEIYTLKGELTYTDSSGKEHIQKFEKDFKYEKDGTTNNIKNMLKAPFDNSHSWIIYILLLFLLLLILFYLRKKKENEAEKAVELAEETLLNKDYEIAQLLVNKLSKRSKQREILQIRLNAVREAIQNNQIDSEPQN